MQKHLDDMKVLCSEHFLDVQVGVLSLICVGHMHLPNEEFS